MASAPVWDHRPIRPSRDDIAVPPLPPGVEWVGEEPPGAERITARGPALVHFFELGELSGVRTLPYGRAWRDRYEPHGLTVLGVHSPRSALAAETERLAAGLARLGIDFPVANDREHRIWHDYGCQGWPSMFLWGKGGNLRWVHFGEGEYRASEEAIQAELAELDPEAELPAPLDPLRAVDEPGVEVARPSPELLPGGSLDLPWTPEPGEPLEVAYAGAGCWAALDGEGEITAASDEGERRQMMLDGPGLYELAEHDRHGSHEVRVDFDGEIRVWSVAFAAGLPPR